VVRSFSYHLRNRLLHGRIDVVRSGGQAISGLGVVFLGVGATTLVQLETPDHLRGRVNAMLMWIRHGMRPIGALAGGALASWVGLQMTVWIVTVGLTLTALMLFAYPRPTRLTPLDGATLPLGSGR
jgi:hypothetical protein